MIFSRSMSRERNSFEQMNSMDYLQVDYYFVCCGIKSDDIAHKPLLPSIGMLNPKFGKYYKANGQNMALRGALFQELTNGHCPEVAQRLPTDQFIPRPKIQLRGLLSARGSCSLLRPRLLFCPSTEEARRGNSARAFSRRTTSFGAMYGTPGVKMRTPSGRPMLATTSQLRRIQDTSISFT
jgi:hypothetical protein